MNPARLKSPLLIFNEGGRSHSRQNAQFDEDLKAVANAEDASPFFNKGEKLVFETRKGDPVGKRLSSALLISKRKAAWKQEKLIIEKIDFSKKPRLCMNSCDLSAPEKRAVRHFSLAVNPIS